MSNKYYLLTYLLIEKSSMTQSKLFHRFVFISRVRQAIGLHSKGAET